MRYWLYDTINGIWSGIPLCCIKSWNKGYTGTNMLVEDPLWSKVEYVRCPMCIQSGKLIKIRHNGMICRGLVQHLWELS